MRFLNDSNRKMESFPPPDKKKPTEINKCANAQRINNAKSALGIDRKTSTTQNADLMERLLSCFEMIHPSAVESSSSSIAKTDVLQAPVTAPSRPVQPSSSSVEVPVRQHTRKRQIYVESTVDDGSFVCTKSSLQALCKYFTTNPLCEFCGKDYKWGSATFVRLKFPVYAMARILGSVLEFWGTL